MSAYLLDQRVTDGHDHPGHVARLREFQQRRHREHCTDCECEATVTVSTIETTYFIDDVAGGPLGVTRSRVPMVETTYRRPRERN